MKTPDQIMAGLGAPMPFEVRPLDVRERHDGAVAGAIGYLDRGDVLNRLDEVLGVDGWQSQFSVLDKALVECRIGIRFGEEWLWKGDVGSGDADDPENGMKGAYSDALKRAATQWGVGRFLYDLGRYILPCETFQDKNGKVRFKRWACDPESAILSRARAQGITWAEQMLRAKDEEKPRPQGGQPPTPPSSSSSTPKDALPPSQQGTPPSSDLLSLMRERGLDKNTVKAYCASQFNCDTPSNLPFKTYQQLLADIAAGKVSAAKAA